MEKEKNNGGLIALVIILFLLVLVLGGYIVYDKVLSKSETPNNPTQSQQENTSTTSSVKTVSDVVGQYTAKFENLKSDGDMNTASITLNLYENGVFTYVFSQYAPFGTLGNYTIDGDKIILTNWFNTNSGTGLDITKGTKTLTINSDGSIIDNSIKTKLLVDNEITTVTLTKSSNSTQFDLSNRLGTGLFTESNHTISEPAM